MLFIFNPLPLLIWLVLAWIIGVLGSRKRFGFLGNFLIALLLSPLVGVIVLLSSDERRVRRG
ncbi:MAG: hypothetical protein AAFY35_01260 [Pseudomonadota bacterium]